MTTPITPVVTDELIAELEDSANQATHKNWAGRGDEIGYISHEDDQSYGMFCPLAIVHSERNVDYISMVTPRLILALIAERDDLKQQLAVASVDADRWRYARADTSAGKSDICVVKKIWGDGRNYTQEIILTEAEADAAIDAARDIAAMDIGSGD